MAGSEWRVAVDAKEKRDFIPQDSRDGQEVSQEFEMTDGGVRRRGGA